MEAKVIFKDLEDDSGYAPFGWEYDPIVESFGEIIIRVEDDAYQGDLRYVIKKGDKFGWVIIGFGSCTGCDWLQGCGSWVEVQELIDSVEKDIEWHDSLESLKDRFKTKDWELEYSFRADETKKFIKEVSEL